MKVICWGTRGSIPVSGKETSVYGGNTTCIQVILNDETYFIFDAGTGIRVLGNYLLQNSGKINTSLFLTHFHLDHIIGFPFFRPLYTSKTTITIYGPKLTTNELKETINGILARDYFPVDLNYFKANIEFEAIGEDSFKRENAVIKTIYVNHPALTLGYRVEYKGKVFVLLTDHEPYTGFVHTIPTTVGLEKRDPNELEDRVNAFIEGADLLIQDGQFTQQEYQKNKKAWGHGPIEYVIENAARLNVKQVLITHHDPERVDEELEKLNLQMKKLVEEKKLNIKVDFARDYMEIDV